MEGLSASARLAGGFRWTGESWWPTPASTGSTAGIAQKIGAHLSEAGHSTDVLPVDRVSDLTLYRAAVIGSAVYVG